jgi:hypothetical protein
MAIAMLRVHVKKKLSILEGTLHSQHHELPAHFLNQRTPSPGVSGATYLQPINNQQPGHALSKQACICLPPLCSQTGSPLHSEPWQAHANKPEN